MEKAKLLVTRPDSPPVGSWAHGVGHAGGLLAQPWKVGTPHAPRYDTGDPQPLCMPQRGAPLSEGKDRADHHNTKSVMLKHLFWVAHTTEKADWQKPDSVCGTKRRL